MIKTRVFVLLAVLGLVAVGAEQRPIQDRQFMYRTSFFPQDHAAAFAAAFHASQAAATTSTEKPQDVDVEELLSQFAEPDPRLEKRTVARGRPNFRPGKRFMDDYADVISDYAASLYGPVQFAFEPVDLAKRSVAFGRQNFRPAKRSVALARTGFRPAKRGVPIDELY